jgi:hypothetical protein
MWAEQMEQWSTEAIDASAIIHSTLLEVEPEGSPFSLRPEPDVREMFPEDLDLHYAPEAGYIILVIPLELDYPKDFGMLDFSPPRASTPKPKHPVLTREHLIPDFIVFLMSHHADEKSLRLPFLVVEVKPIGSKPFSRTISDALPQVFLQARFALEKYVDLQGVYSMCIVGLDWRMFSFSRGVTTDLPTTMRSTHLPDIDAKAVIRLATAVNTRKVSLLDKSKKHYHQSFKNAWKHIAEEHGIDAGLDSADW